MTRYLKTKKAAFGGNLANAASSFYSIAIRKRTQEKSKKKVGTIPKTGL
jgi:hypothetical protein